MAVGRAWKRRKAPVKATFATEGQSLEEVRDDTWTNIATWNRFFGAVQAEMMRARPAAHSGGCGASYPAIPLRDWGSSIVRLRGTDVTGILPAKASKASNEERGDGA